MDEADENIDARKHQVEESAASVARAPIAKEIPVSHAAASLTSHPAAQKERELPTNA